MNRKELKSLAKKQIKGNIGILFLCGIIVVLLGDIVPVVGSIILIPVLSYGIVLNYLAMNKGEGATVERVFDGFKDFGRAWCVYFFEGLFIFLWSLLFFIPGIVKAVAYSFAPFILAENPGMSAMDAITASKEMTKGHKWELFVLLLSFFWWYLLGYLTLGIAFIWIMPYVDATFVNAYQSIKNKSVSPVTAEIENA